jgi:hypothetical protein
LRRSVSNHSCPRRAKPRHGSAAPTFLPARLVETPPVRTGEPLLEIVLGDKCVVRVGGGADPELIEHFLALALPAAALGYVAPLDAALVRTLNHVIGTLVRLVAA